jgi:hypothetical protein
MMGDIGMTVSYEKYFDEKFESVNKRIVSLTGDVKTLTEQIGNMPCVEHKERIAQNEQRLDSGDKFGEKAAEEKHQKTMERFSLWKVLISAAALAILIFQVLRAFGITK